MVKKTKPDFNLLISDLNALADQMNEVSASMIDLGELNENWLDHVDQLLGASLIAKAWAKEIEQQLEDKN